MPHMDDDALAAGDTVEAGLVRALDLLGQALERLQDDDAARALVLAARQEVDEAALLVPAIGRVAFV